MERLATGMAAALSRVIGSETQRPRVVVIDAGTLSACALTLALLPVMYRLFVLASERVAARLGQGAEPAAEASSAVSRCVGSGCAAPLLRGFS